MHRKTYTTTNIQREKGFRSSASVGVKKTYTMDATEEAISEITEDTTIGDRIEKSESPPPDIVTKKRASLNRSDKFRRLIRKKHTSSLEREESNDSDNMSDNGERDRGTSSSSERDLDNISRSSTSSERDVLLQSSRDSASSERESTPKDLEPCSVLSGSDTENNIIDEKSGLLTPDEVGVLEQIPEGSQDEEVPPDGAVVDYSDKAALVAGNFGRLLYDLASLLYSYISQACQSVYNMVTGWFHEDIETVNNEQEIIDTKTPDTAKEDPQAKLSSRIYHICNELMTTEDAYVERLGLLVKAKEKAAKVLNADVAKEMFKDVEVIYQFHHDYLLPQLTERMSNWLQYEKIGDVMKKLTPFLKLYTEYVKDFQKASALVENYDRKSSAFAAALKDIQDTQSARCGRLTIQAHMMEPVQRVPRYKLLLTDYAKRIPNDSPDYEDTQKALVLVSEAASHFESMMKRDSRIGRLMSVQSRLEGSVNVVQGNRELIREARIDKVSPGHAKTSHKYAFLFNDMLAICNKQTLVSNRFKIRHVVHLGDIEAIHEGCNLEIPYTFCIKCTDEQLDFCTSNQEELKEWVEHLLATVSSHKGEQMTYTGTLDYSTLVHDSENILKQGGVQFSADDGKTWKRRWLLLHTTGCLMACKSQQELHHFTAVKTSEFNKALTDNLAKGRTLLLASAHRKYYFYDSSEQDLQAWYDGMLHSEEAKKEV